MLKKRKLYKEKKMELSLDSGLVFIPKTISDFLAEVSSIKDNFDKLSKLDDYVQKLEDEMRKIEAFKRELPLSMLLLNDAIAKLKEKEPLFKEFKDGSFAEELIPLKRNLDEKDGKVNLRDDLSDKRTWLSSVQLWNTNIDCDFRKYDSVSELKLRNKEGDRYVPENPIELCNYKNRGEAFVSCKEHSGCGLLRTNMKEDNEVLQVPILSLKPPIAELSGSSILDSKSSPFFMDEVKLPSKTQHPLQQYQSLRKQRRCWSPELHRRFIEALQQLGGSQVATPKQIREIMQVDGLTNDEVKSHLQKYRLHVRKLTPLSQNHLGDLSKTSQSQSSSPQGPLLVGGSVKGLSSTCVDSMETEEDEKSEGYSWKGGFNRSREDI